jgi:hypothetical protein
MILSITLKPDLKKGQNITLELSFILFREDKSGVFFQLISRKSGRRSSQKRKMQALRTRRWMRRTMNKMKTTIFLMKTQSRVRRRIHVGSSQSVSST